MSQDELLLVVDENNQPVEPLPRRVVHGGPAWRRVVHVWAVNAVADILCHQRSLHKDIDPGLWTSSISGHMGPGEDYAPAAAREVEEEIGLVVAPDELQLWKVYQHTSKRRVHNEFQAVFILHWNGRAEDLRFNDGEVQRVAWVAAAEVAAKTFEAMPGWVNIGYERALFTDMGWL